MRHIFIINPAAGKYDRTEEYTQVIRRICGVRGLEYTIACSKVKGDCRRIAHEAAESGEECRLYACGGDGTLNEVVNGAAGYENVAITHFPGGSGNDTIKMFSEPSAFFDLERLLDCDEARFDLIRCNDEYSINIVSMGLDARVAHDMSKYKRLPLLSGKGSYILSLIVNLLKGLSMPMQITIDGKELHNGRQTLICVCNGRWYGGGFNPVPEAEPDDGLLDVLVVKKVGLLVVSKLLGKYKAGRYNELSQYIDHYLCRTVQIDTGKPAVVNIDGETIHASLASARILPKAVRFFYPRGLQFEVQK